MAESQDATAQTFGEFFRQRRVATGLTLRSFCNRFGFDPAYISRVETDLLAPPSDKDKLSALAKALGITQDSMAWVDFFDLAYLAKGRVPVDILADKKSQRFLPLLFRTVRGQRLSKKKLQELVNLINNE